MFAHNIISILTFVQCCFSISSGVDVNRRTNYGDITGRLFEFSNITAEVFLGVPYAQPPIDELRFEYSLPPIKWSGLLECKEMKLYCNQIGGFEELNQQSEDCLHLNIFVPHQKETNKTYPVLVWIHGGSYFAGSANKFPINTTVINLVSKDIIVVFVNYRLGPLGFLSLGNNSLPGNYGLEDQLFALKWVNENIHYFNGDPKQITLTGESAGGVSVSLLAISTKAKGLIRNVMPQSGCSLSMFALSQERTIQNTKAILQQLNCSVGINRRDLLSCLRNVNSFRYGELLASIDTSVTAFVQRKDNPRNLNHHLLPQFTPVIDDYRNEESILDDVPEVLLQRNSNITMLIGCTNREVLDTIYHDCQWWSFLQEQLSSEQILSIDSEVSSDQFPYTIENDRIIGWEIFIPASLFENPQQVYEAIEDYYKIGSGSNSTELIKQISKITSDLLFLAPAVLEANYYAKNNKSVYFYYYSEDKNRIVVQWYDPKCGNSEDYKNLASHGHDMARLFQSGQLLFRPASEDDRWEEGNLEMTKFLSNMITNFVKNGNPNDDQSEQKWQQYSSENKSAFFIHPKTSHMIDIEAESNYKFWFGTLPVIKNKNVKNNNNSVLSSCNKPMIIIVCCEFILYNFIILFLTVILD